jgi:DNA-directed RNA polymerase subunit N (RpoN/RPB10)
MIIPIRCFTCNQLIANKWEIYTELLKEKNDEDTEKNKNTEYILTTQIINDIKETQSEDKVKSNIGKALDDLGLIRYCCRRHFIGHKELIQFI